MTGLGGLAGGGTRRRGIVVVLVGLALAWVVPAWVAPAPAATAATGATAVAGGQAKVVFGAGGTEAGGASSGQDADPARGMTYAGLERSSRCPSGTFAVGDTGRCTHGPDPAPPGVTVDTPAPLAVGDGSIQSVPCDGDGSSGKRVQVIYAHAADVTDRYATVLASLQSYATQADTDYSQAAQFTGGTRHIRYVQDPGTCVPTVLDVTLTASGDDTFSNTVTELGPSGQNFNDANRDYLVFMDANLYCGIAQFWGESSNGPDNYSNGGKQFARVDSGCWSSARVTAHELGHNFGAVSNFAPNSSRGGHCVERFDTMCYSDTPLFPPLTTNCEDPAHDAQLDCGNDDYYSTNPPAGNYLATHWNVADNQFLIGAPAPDTSPPPNDSFASATALVGPSGTVIGDNIAATPQAGEPSLGYGSSSTTWWTFTPASSGPVIIDTGSTYWCTKVGVYTGSAVNGLTSVATDGTCNSAMPMSVMSFSATASTTYRILVTSTFDTVWGFVGTGRYTLHWALGTPPAPPAPTSLLAVDGAAGHVDLSWNDNAGTETGYVVERATGTGAFAVVATLPANTYQWSDPAAVDNTEYRYRVRATGAGGSSAYSTVAFDIPRVSTNPTSVPLAPSSAAAATQSSSSVLVSWNDNSSNEWSFKVWRQTGGAGPYVKVAVLPAGSTSFLDTGLAASTLYSYAISASNWGGDSARTSPVSATTSSPSPPAAPTLLASGTVTSASVALTWTDNANNETGFELERSTTGVGGPFSQVGATLPANTTSTTDSTVAASTTYYYRVRSTNGAGDSGPSNVVTVTTPAVPPPSAPTGLVATAVGPTQINLQWVDASNNETGFALERSSTGPAGAYSPVGSTLPAGTTTYADSSVLSSSTYHYRVRATGATSDSAPSNVAAATTWAPPVLNRFTGVAPTRVVDSRDGTGGYSSKWGATTSRLFQITGSAIPSAATAVVVNVTGITASTPTHISVTPDCVVLPATPSTSNLNIPTGEARANLVTVALGSGGHLCIFNNAGTIDVAADIVGYYQPSVGDGHTAITPTRLLDSRDGTGGYSSKWGPATSRPVQITGGAVPNGATSVVLNVGAVGTSTGTHLSVTPDCAVPPAVPSTSNLNLVAGDVRANSVVVPLGAGGQVCIFNNAGTTDVIADAVGYFTPSGGDNFTPVTPARILDSRDGTGGYSSKWSSALSRPLAVTGAHQVPVGAKAVVMNVTAVGASATTHISVVPVCVASPTSSNLNVFAGQTVPNLVVVKTAAAGTICLYNNSGTIDLLADVVGFYS